MAQPDDPSSPSPSAGTAPEGALPETAVPDTSTPEAARAHARAQAAAASAAWVVPATDAGDLPDGVDAAQVVWDETLPPGAYTTRRIGRGTHLHLTDRAGDASVALVVHSAANPAERLNVADTLKVQWNAYLTEGMLLLSAMGRVLATVVSDTSGHHDLLCGLSTAAGNDAIFGDGTPWGPCPSAEDRLAVALARWGLDRRDLTANVNLFTVARVGSDGSLQLDPDSVRPGAHICLRAEMDLLVSLAHTSHPLAGPSQYPSGEVRVLAWSGAPAAADDPWRSVSPEAERAFANTDDYLAAAGVTTASGAPR
ncbi:MAG: DUF1989 domain-containing protein [Acidimicrobiia bacterium]|nr:DUF1989 domain-containing protein [Acidimicrobiia bacterium]